MAKGRAPKRADVAFALFVGFSAGNLPDHSLGWAAAKLVFCIVALVFYVRALRRDDSSAAASMQKVSTQEVEAFIRNQHRQATRTLPGRGGFRG